MLRTSMQNFAEVTRDEGELPHYHINDMHRLINDMQWIQLVLFLQM